MQTLRQVVLDYVGGELRKQLVYVPNITVEDERKRQALYIQKIVHLQTTPVYFLRSITDVKALWQTIRDDSDMYEFVTGGTYYLEMFGWSTPADRNLRIRQVASAAEWIHGSVGIDEATKDAAYKGSRQADHQSIFHTDPWLVFIAIIQTIDTSMLLEYINQPKGNTHDSTKAT